MRALLHRNVAKRRLYSGYVVVTVLMMGRKLLRRWLGNRKRDCESSSLCCVCT